MDQSLKDKDNLAQTEKSDSNETRYRETSPPPENVDPVVTIVRDPPDGDDSSM